MLLMTAVQSDLFGLVLCLAGTILTYTAGSLPRRTGESWRLTLLRLLRAYWANVRFVFASTLVWAMLGLATAAVIFWHMAGGRV